MKMGWKRYCSPLQRFAGSGQRHLSRPIFFNNLAIATNVIEASGRTAVEKLLLLGFRAWRRSFPDAIVGALRERNSGWRPAAAIAERRAVVFCATSG
jgi:hypothetical protein